ncbi:MAG: type II secretion system protein [Candidatus Levybacteria bacterium]|nr:type II secretion system protein [Candidatus Levybacteria bacterium]
MRGTQPTTHNTFRGFTLIELLVVIGILAVLLAITLIAINPARQFAQANNTKRRSDVNAILNAVHQYAADNQGDITALNITTTLQNISSAGSNFCTLVVPQYIAALPSDPTVGTPVASANIIEADCTGVANWDTGYDIQQISDNSRITVSAPGAELSETISVTR